jgi:hypothetical protein
MQTSSMMPFRNVSMLTQTIAPAHRRIEPVSKRFAMPEPKREARIIAPPTPDHDREDAERWDGLA